MLIIGMSKVIRAILLTICNLHVVVPVIESLLLLDFSTSLGISQLLFVHLSLTFSTFHIMFYLVDAILGLTGFLFKLSYSILGLSRLDL